MDINRYLGLHYSENFKNTSQVVIDFISNGCGPKTKFGILAKLVPDYLLFSGMDLSPACDIHDFDYYDDVPKKEADQRFLKNMLIIANRRPIYIRWLAKRICYVYYYAVSYFGNAAYQDPK